MKRFILLMSLTALLFACEKEETAKPTHEAEQTDLSIELISPKENSDITHGKDTTVRILIADALSLHEYYVLISNSQEEEIHYVDGHTHAPEKELAFSWNNNVAPGEDIHLEVVASNHKGQVLKKNYLWKSVE